MWTAEHSIETEASPEAISQQFEDVARWPEWNAGTECVELDGPFTAGTTGRMKVPGQVAFGFRLIAVDPSGFEDETPFPDAGIVVRVRHTIEQLDQGRVRIVYRTTIDGPNADALGPALGPQITADFPTVLEALVTRVRPVSAPR